MPIQGGLEWTFDTNAAMYAKLRPGYVDALYEALFRYIPIDRDSRVVEVGIGGGQATKPLLDAGCTLTAVECGARFCELCRAKFGEYPGFSVVNSRFEDMDFADGSCDLVYSASAFHWIPEEIGYRKVFAMLHSGGAFARFANHPFRDKGQPALSADIEALYHQYYDPCYPERQAPPTEYTEAAAKERALIAEKYGFTDIQWHTYKRTRTFSATEYTALLGTYSDHINLEERLRGRFFGAIEEAINRHGGQITVYDTIDLQLARKP